MVGPIIAIRYCKHLRTLNFHSAPFWAILLTDISTIRQGEAPSIQYTKARIEFLFHMNISQTFINVAILMNISSWISPSLFSHSRSQEKNIDISFIAKNRRKKATRYNKREKCIKLMTSTTSVFSEQFRLIAGRSNQRLQHSLPIIQCEPIQSNRPIVSILPILQKNFEGFFGVLLITLPVKHCPTKY